MTTPKTLPDGVTRRGERYRATHYVGLDQLTGRKVRRSKSFSNKRDAVAWLNAQRSSATRTAAGSPATLGELLEKWLTRQRWRVDIDGSLAGTTYAWYEGAVRRHIAPAPLSRIQLRDLTADALSGFLTEKRARGRLDGSGGLSRSSLRRLTVVLAAALSWAHSERWIESNPAESVQIRSDRGSEKARELTWTVDTLRTFLDYHAGHRLAAAWRLQAVTGARRGEVLGLKWADLRIPDIGDPSISIRRSWVLDGAGRPILREPKTAGSIRAVPIDTGTVEVLDAWRDRQDVDRGEWVEAFDPSGWMFTREDGSPIRPDTYTKTFSAACREAGVPVISPHSLRHLAGTMLLEAGVPSRVVADVLGHSSTRVTNDVYMHVRESIAAQAVGRIASQLGAQPATESAPTARHQVGEIGENASGAEGI